MGTNRRQREAIACALTGRHGVEYANPDIIVDIMCAGCSTEVLEILEEQLLLSQAQLGHLLPAVCKAAGITLEGA